MKIWEITTEFPFRSVRILNYMILLFGCVLICLGIFDVVWTAVKYTGLYNECPTTWPFDLQSPCDHNNLVWTWIASAIWGGFVVVLAAVPGVILTSEGVKNIRYTRDMYIVGCVLLSFPVLPAVIICTTLEMVYGSGIFYKSEGNDINLGDTAKFVVPLLVAVLAFFLWIMAVAAAIAVCYYRLKVERKMLVRSPQQKLNQVQPIVIQNTATTPQVPVIVSAPAPQPQVQYEIQAITSPPPPPYIVYGPHPEAARIDRINQEILQMGPSLGPPIGPFPPEMFGLGGGFPPPPPPMFLPQPPPNILPPPTMLLPPPTMPPPSRRPGSMFSGRQIGSSRARMMFGGEWSGDPDSEYFSRPPSRMRSSYY